jgi:SHS2 domain-containing protein
MTNRLQFLEHTADVGFDLTADSLPGLFRLAATGLYELLLGEEELTRHGSLRQKTQDRTVHLTAEEPALLLAAWLRELLHLIESENSAALQIEFGRLSEHELEARMVTAPVEQTPVREIKAVTYHQLNAQKAENEWKARVIFDV